LFLSLYLVYDTNFRIEFGFYFKGVLLLVEIII